MQPTRGSLRRPGISARLTKYRQMENSDPPQEKMTAPLREQSSIHHRSAFCSRGPFTASPKLPHDVCTTVPILAVGTNCSSYVSHVEDGPYNFSVQLKISVDSLLPELNSLLASHQHHSVVTQLIPGSIVLAKTTDEIMKRAVVTNILPDACKVYNIDYGSSDKLPLKSLFHLPPQALNFSQAMAIRFSLTNLKSQQLSDAQKDYFALLVMGKQVLIIVKEKESISSMQFCEMFLERRNVLEMLLNLSTPPQYSPQVPPLGDRETSVTVVNVGGPTRFHVHYYSDISIVFRIGEALSAYCRTRPRVTETSTIPIGSQVAVLHEYDKLWYRAVVLAVETTDVRVNFVDYGDTIVVKPKQLCFLSRELVDIWRAQALECCLTGFDTNLSYSFLAQKMRGMVSNKLYKLKVYASENKSRLCVDLIDIDGRSLATDLQDILEEKQKVELPEESIKHENHLSSADRQKSRSESSMVPQHHQELAEFGCNNLATTETPNVVLQGYQHQQFNVGVEYKTYFVAMGSQPTDVYVQLADCDEKLEKIQQMIAIHESAALGLCQIKNATVAMPVLAKYTEDGVLYRASIKGIAESNTGLIDILFVDYGNSAVVGLEDIYIISSELMSVPVQAVHVYLADMPTGAITDVCLPHFTSGPLMLRVSQVTTTDLEPIIEGVLLSPDCISVAELVKDGPTSIEERLSNLAVSAESGKTSPALTDAATASTPVFPENPSTDTQSGTLQASGQLNPAPWLENLNLLLGQCLLAKVVQVVAIDVYAVKITAALDLVVLVQSDSPIFPDQLATGSDVLVQIRSKTEDRLLAEFYDRAGTSLSRGTSRSPLCPAQIVCRSATFSVTHVQNDVIYLQTERNEQMAQFLELLYGAYETSIAKSSASFSIGDLCVAKSNDENWYRARVVSVVGALYTVYYLDYGNTEDVVGSDKLRHLIPKFMCPEKCVGVVVPVRYLDVDQCMKSVICENQTPIQCTFIEWNSNRGVWIADLHRGNYSESLSQHWIEKGLASSIDGDIPTDIHRREPGWNLKKGDVLPIVITHSTSLSQLWVQLSSQIQAIEVLQTTLQASLSTKDGGPSQDLGALFAAKYSQDNLWYRAVRFEDKVKFIDYGNVDLATDVKTLPQALYHPTSGYALALNLCVEPIGSDWLEEAEQLFEAFINNKLAARVISVDFHIIVDLENEGRLLSDALLEAGLAKPLEPKLFDGIIVEDEVPAGTTTGTVSACVSINDFYLQVQEQTAILDHLNKLLENAEQFEVVVTPHVGQYLVAQFLVDARWYRAKVTSEDPRTVLFLDYGNEALATEFRKMPPQLAFIPLMAWRCTANAGNNAEVNESFTELVDNGKVFSVTFTGRIAQLYEVQLETVEGPLLRSVATLHSVSESNGQAEQMDQEHNDAGVQNLPDVGSQVALIANDIVRTDDLETHAQPTVALESLQNSTSVFRNCEVVHFNGSDDFYVHTEEGQKLNQEVLVALLKGDTFPMLDKVNKGDLVVAKYPEDSCYYRAVITQIEPETVAKFIDFGNSCPASIFHELPKSLCFPQLAMRCSLKSTRQGEDDYLLQQLSEFVDVKVVVRGDPNIVEVQAADHSLTAKLSEKPDCSNDQSVDPFQRAGQCVVTSAQPSGIYIRDTSCYSELDRINKRMAHIVTTKPSMQRIPVDKLVAAYHNKELARGRVARVSPTCVFFIDTGVTAEVDCVYELPEPASTRGLAQKVDIDWGDELVLTNQGLDVLMELTAGGAQYTFKGPSTVELCVNGTNMAELVKSHLVTPSPITNH